MLRVSGFIARPGQKIRSARWFGIIRLRLGLHEQVLLRSWGFRKGATVLRLVGRRLQPIVRHSYIYKRGGDLMCRIRFRVDYIGLVAAGFPRPKNSEDRGMN